MLPIAQFCSVLENQSSQSHYQTVYFWNVKNGYQSNRERLCMIQSPWSHAHGYTYELSVQASCLFSSKHVALFHGRTSQLTIRLYHRFTGKSTIFVFKKVTDCFVARTSHQVPLKKEAHTRTHAAFLRRWAWPNNVLCLVGEEVCAGLLYLVPATYYKWTLMTTTYDMMECYDSFPAVAWHKYTFS